MRGGFQTVEDNLRVAMRFFGEASGSGEVRAADGVRDGLLRPGLRRVQHSDAGAAGFLRARPDHGPGHRRRFYHERKVRWSFWICEDLLDPSARRHSREIFTEAGLRTISHAPGMVALALTAPSRPLPAIECRAVSDAARALPSPVSP